MAPVNGIDTYKLQANHRPVQDSQLSASAGSTGNSAVAHVRNPEEIKNSILLSLVKGQTINGEVTDLRNNDVKLLLQDGRTLFATLKNISTLSIGDTASFKVLSATNESIALKLEGNPVRNTLLSTINRALSAAGLQVNERNSEAVSELMRAGLPIKASSVLGIIEASANHPNASFQTLARLMQMELPLTEENAALVEAYNRHELSLGNAVSELSDRVFTAFTEIPNESSGAAEAEIAADGAKDAKAVQSSPVNSPANSQANSPENSRVNSMTAGSAPLTDNTALLRAQLFDTIRNLGDAGAGSLPFSDYLSENQINALNGMLAGIGETYGISLSVGPELSMNDLAQMIGANDPGNAVFSAASVTPEFASAVSMLLERHWSLSPSELLEGKNRPGELAGQILQESENVSRVLRAFEDSAGRQTAGKQEASAQARSSVDFAGMINELYPYIQIPVELRGGTVHSELFVYRKKNSGPLNKDDKISVMLHLDMEALGPLDVRVEMNRENISTRFFVNDTVSEQLINDNLHLLDKALSDKGYIFTGEVDGAKVGRNPLEDFLTGHESGQVKRYTFDIRA